MPDRLPEHSPTRPSPDWRAQRARHSGRALRNRAACASAISVLLFARPVVDQHELPVAVGLGMHGRDGLLNEALRALKKIITTETRGCGVMSRASTAHARAGSSLHRSVVLTAGS